MSTATPEYLTTLRDGFADAVQQWVDQSTTAWEQWAQAWTPVARASADAMTTTMGMPRATPGARPHHGHRRGEKDCGCGDRRHDGCCGDACDCCVPDADVVVRARAGEVRVVPFRLRNQWRREREVTLEVGPWHVCDGDGDVQVRARLEETKLVLKPCEDRVVRLVLTAAAGPDGQAVEVAETAGEETRAPAKRSRTSDRTPEVPDERRTADLDACFSAYADVRFEGCARPQRVALVVSPADCDAVDVCCDCGCCQATGRQ